MLTSVERVRLRGVDADPTTARLQLGSLLGTAELRPRGLPPAAVLCVRRLADPLPGRIELDSTQARPPPEWERAFVDALTRLLERAARPAREAVPANAEAVLFADRAELLACLARDARDGVAWTRWWWRSLWPAAPPGGDPVVAAWLAAPEHVPGALALLAARGEAVSFVGALPLGAAAQLAQRVAAAYGAVELQRALAPLAAPWPARRARGSRAVAQDRGGSDALHAAPWTAKVPEAHTQPLAPAREALLGVALALRRTPVAAGTGAFATAVSTWLEQATSATAPIARPHALRAQRTRAAGPPERTPVAPSPARLPHTPAARTTAATAKRSAQKRLRAAPPAPRATKAATVPDQPSLPNAAPPTRHPTPHDVPAQARRDAPQAAPETAIAASPLSPAANAAPAARAVTPSATALPPARADRRLVPPAPAAPEDTEPPEEPWEAPAVGIETALGGVFYLLNLFLYLGLYGDFTQPLARGLALDPWRCVALVARRLLAPGDRADPLWEVLERLASPSTFRPPRAWRTPAGWLEPFDPGGVWHWSAAGGMLRLEHPAGFPVLALARTREPAHAQLARELRRLRIAPALRRTSLRREPAQPLARWVARLSAYAEARLRVALELPLDTLLRRRARVFVTASHVDVVLSLSELPLEVRFAGLDRTPGWIPAAGRFVAFHFE